MVSINECYESAIERIKREIDDTEDNTLLHTNASELTEFYVKTTELRCIEKDNTRNIEIKKQKTPNYGTVQVDILYPIITGKTFLERARLQEVIALSATTNFSDGHPYMKINGDWLEITTEGNENWIKQALEDLEQVIFWKNLDIKNGNERLKNEISSYILRKQEEIKREYAQLESIVEKMTVPITIRRNELQPVIDFGVKEELTQLKPKPEENQDISLNSYQVASIIKYIRNSCLSFEKTPRVFSKLEEEDLRDIILGNLNAIFEGNATGETFSKSGKTDVHLAVTQKNVLIIECKFWGGIEKYSRALEQLFSYLTWRNTHAILITFSRNKDCLDVTRKAKEVTSNHKSYINEPLSVNHLGEFITMHKNPNAPDKSLEVHHLIFDLFYQQVVY